MQFDDAVLKVVGSVFSSHVTRSRQFQDSCCNRYRQLSTTGILSTEQINIDSCVILLASVQVLWHLT